MKKRIIIANLIRYAAQMCVFIVLLNLIYNSGESSSVKTALYIISAISLILILVAGVITNSAVPTIDDITSNLRESLERLAEEAEDEPHRFMREHGAIEEPKEERNEL